VDVSCCSCMTPKSRFNGCYTAVESPENALSVPLNSHSNGYAAAQCRRRSTSTTTPAAIVVIMISRIGDTPSKNVSRFSISLS